MANIYKTQATTTTTGMNEWMDGWRGVNPIRILVSAQARAAWHRPIKHPYFIVLLAPRPPLVDRLVAGIPEILDVLSRASSIH